MCPSIRQMRIWLHEHLEVPEGGHVVDVGCGLGEDIRLLAENKPQAGFLTGIDSDEKTVLKARLTTNDPKIKFEIADASKRWPLRDRSVDAVYSLNLLECLLDKQKFVHECARVLKPGGSIVVAHFDWDTQTFNGEDKALVRRIVHAYADWQQPWMQNSDAWAGRRLSAAFHAEPRLVGEVHPYTIVESSRAEGYGEGQLSAFASLARRGLITEEDFKSFVESQDELEEAGSYFFSITLFAFVGVKV